MTAIAEGTAVKAKRAPKPKAPKVRTWTFNNVTDREVATALNKLSASGAVVFGVYQSLSIGGTYGVLSYKDEVAEEYVKNLSLPPIKEG